MTNALLDTENSFTAAYAAYRNAGFWAGLGTGFNGAVDAIAIDVHGRVWFAGNFTTANGVTVNRICYWDGTTFQAIGGATPGADGRVRAIAIDPNGEDIVFTGDFANVAGSSSARICKYDFSAGTFSNFGTGLNSTGRCLLITRAGVLYVGGDFTTANGVTVNRVTYWNGTTFVAMTGGGVSAGVYALAQSIAGHILAGGAFTTARTTPLTVNYVAYHNGTNWYALGTSATVGVNGNVYAIAVTPDDQWYFGGAFTTADGAAALRIVGFNTQGFYQLSAGLPDTVWSLRYNAYDRRLWLGGDFLFAGSNTAMGYIGTWSGTAWSHVDINLPGSFTVTAIAVDGERVYLGGDATGTATCAGSTTLTGAGSAGSPPTFVIKRTGGTAATIESFINTTYNRRLILRYAMSDGETVTINLATGKMTSDVYGNIIGNIFADSNEANWLVEPGANVVASFVYNAGATITAYAVWQNHYLSIDGGGQ